VTQDLGPVIWTKFLKTAMLHVVLDWQQKYKTVLEKAFLFSFWRFYLLWLWCQQIRETIILRDENFFP
jgi:hypothetical protein